MLLDGLWFRYGRRADWTLRDVRVAVLPGVPVVLLGRNGAGKSTLLQLAAGVLRPVRGVVRDRPAVVGWVPERFPTEQPFHARQYLLRTAAVRGLAAPAAARAVGAWAERLGLEAHLDSPLTDLSKGTAQKVGLAQALLVPPGLLVLDEPWEGLDSVARTMVPQIVAEVCQAGGAVLISDHRGEIAGLTDAVRWSVHDAMVQPDDAPPAADDGPRADEVVVEVVVGRADAPALMGRLRADGHRIVRVRPPVSS